MPAKREYDPTDRGMLFRVTKKKSENHPDLNGKINIGGTDHWLSGWWQKYTDTETGEIRTGISLSLGDAVVSKSEAKRGATQRGIPQETKRQPAPPPEDDETEGDIPF